MSKKRLGKGLGALLDTDGLEEQQQHSVQEIKISEIEPNKGQPRKNFDEERLKALSDSIKIHGVIQPIIVKQVENGFYQIIAGERRWRAARLAALKKIPVVIKGKEEIEKKRYLLNVLTHKVEIEYKVGDGISEIEVDVSEFEIGDAIYIKDLKVPEGVKVLEDEEKMILNVKEQPVIEEDEEPGEDEDFEPEIVGKEDEESEEKE